MKSAAGAILCIGLFLSLFGVADSSGDSAVVGVDDFDTSALEEYGLTIDLWAAWPEVYSPVAMDVDRQGRLWIIEDWHGREFSEGAKRARAGILIAEDKDGDGRAESFHHFGPTFSSIPLGITILDNRIVVSMAPDLLVFTDVNRDGVFDESIDSREVLLTGFEGHSHDHSLHGVVPGPNGQWYFSQGNCGMNVTGTDGTTIIASSYYSFNPADIGRRSSDGRLYEGGLGLRMNPDGSGLEVFCENTRNTHDMAINSFGDIFHGDNDDPAHARASWVMEYANFGYASLEDGSRSWEEAAKSWEEGVVDPSLLAIRGDARASQSHWRENYPGTTPPDYIWGTGAPMGCVFVEGNELSPHLNGRFLLCETVSKSIFSFNPVNRGAHVEIGANSTLLKLKPSASEKGFLPSEIIHGLDGSLFVSDWNSTNNRRGQGGPEGAIYRIRRADQQSVPVVITDYSTVENQLEALRSPVPGIRWSAGRKLVATPSSADALISFFRNQDNEYYAARALWLLAEHPSPEGNALVQSVLEESDSPEFRLTAYRALRHFHADDILLWSRMALQRDDPALTREVAIALRNVPWSGKSADLLQTVISRYDGKDRWMLEAIGSAAAGREDEVYRSLVRPATADRSWTEWTDRDINLAWRLRSSTARAHLLQVIKAMKPGIAQFRHLIMTYALAFTPEERQENLRYVNALKSKPDFSGEDFQGTIEEVIQKDLTDEPAVILDRSWVFPEKWTSDPTTLPSPAAIAELEGDPSRGRQKGALCLTCHRIGAEGIAFGPNLTQWARGRNLETIISAITHPAQTLAHGYDKPVVLANRDHRLEGIEVGYSYHAGAVKVRTIGGETVKVAFRKSGSPIQRLQNHSWMPSASDMGLSTRDVRDIVEWLRVMADQ